MRRRLLGLNLLHPKIKRTLLLGRLNGRKVPLIEEVKQSILVSNMQAP